MRLSNERYMHLVSSRKNWARAAWEIDTLTLNLTVEEL